MSCVGVAEWGGGLERVMLERRIGSCRNDELNTYGSCLHGFQPMGQRLAAHNEGDFVDQDFEVASMGGGRPQLGKLCGGTRMGGNVAVGWERADHFRTQLKVVLVAAKLEATQCRQSAAWVLDACLPACRFPVVCTQSTYYLLRALRENLVEV